MKHKIRYISAFIAIILISILIIYHYSYPDNSEPFIIIIIISIILFTAISLTIYDMKKGPKPEKPQECVICLKDIPKGRAKLCENWLTETRLCKEGPFCSKKCLKEHLRREVHEHVLGDGL